MRIRRLAPEEHGKTKALYEEVFSEDKGSFSNYYYEWKTRDNVIYAAEDEEGIHSMVQLNPFTVWQDGELRRLRYIVAVATEKEYRHRGLMRSLLTKAMEEMEREGEPFTFLMPASEAIYLPLGFRYFSGQRKGILRARAEGESDGGKESREHGDGASKLSGAGANGSFSVSARPILPEEYAGTAGWVNRILAGSYRVFIWRDEAYYQRMEAELACQGGRLMGIFAEERASARKKARQRLLGTFCLVRGEEDLPEIREVIGEPEDLPEVEHALREQVLRELESPDGTLGGPACMVRGCPEGLRLEDAGWEPLLMARALCEDVPRPPESIFINEIV